MENIIDTLCDWSFLKNPTTFTERGKKIIGHIGMFITIILCVTFLFIYAFGGLFIIDGLIWLIFGKAILINKL